MIAGEVALSAVLLMGAGVMVRGLAALRQVDAGFDAEHVLTMRVTLPETRYSSPSRRTGFFDGALDRMRALPGVRHAGELLPRDQPTVGVRKVTPGCLDAMRIPPLRGHDVSSGAGDVMLVSRAAAALLWGTADPIGRTATLPLQSRTRVLRVVGVVGDIRDDGLTAHPVATIYEYARERPWRSMVFVLRTALPPESLGVPAAGVIRSLDPAQPVEDLRTMSDLVAGTLRAQRFNAIVLLFAGVALALAAVGIYSVLSQLVRGRRREIGIRTALGARTTDVLRLVLYEGLAPTLAGILAGTAAALASGMLLRRLVFGVSPADPVTLAAVAGTLLVVALAASHVPGYRASRVDPLQVLRT